MSSEVRIHPVNHPLRQYTMSELLEAVDEPSLPVRRPTTKSKYIINDIPRGTKMLQLVNYLLAPPHWRGEDRAVSSKLYPHVQFACTITDSRLDDSLSVARVHFIDTPKWLRRLNLDPDGFPKKTPLGTIWRGVETCDCDEDGQTAFLRAAVADNLLYAEALAEFSDTDVNVQDIHGRTALHWASLKNLPNIAMLCLSVPGCDVSLHDNDGLTAFDIALRNKDDRIPDLFYKSILELDSTDRPSALLRILTITSEPDENRPVFPGTEMFEPVVTGNDALVAALIRRRVDLTARNVDGDTALHVAASQVRNTVIVERLLEAGSDIHATGSSGATALHHAARSSDEETVRMLLHWEADPAVEDTNKQTALHWAAENGQLHNARVLLDYGADAEAKDRAGQTAMQLAEANLKQDLVALLKSVNQLPPDVGESSEQRADTQPPQVDMQSGVEAGRTPLLKAALNGDVKLLLALLEQGASLYARDNDGQTALHLAAGRGHTEAVKALLANGAGNEQVNYEGWRILKRLGRSGSNETGNEQIANWAGIDVVDEQHVTALHRSANGGHIETVKELLANGADINAVDKSRCTALHFSASNGHTEIVKVLLANGANVGVVGKDRCTALHFSASYGHTETVKTLLANGADINAVDKSRRTPLHLSAVEGHTETVKELLANRADILAVDKHRWTALHCSAVGGHTETVKELLANGVAVEAVGVHRLTALHCSALDGHSETVKELLANGANVEAVGESRLTALHFSSRGGHTETVKELLASGADINAVDTNRCTALHFARHPEVAKVLLDNGAEIEAQCTKGTALQMALKSGNTAMVEMLTARGAKTISTGGTGYVILNKLGLAK